MLHRFPTEQLRVDIYARLCIEVGISPESFRKGVDVDIPVHFRIEASKGFERKAKGELGTGKTDISQRRWHENLLSFLIRE